MAQDDNEMGLLHGEEAKEGLSDDVRGVECTYV